MAESWIQTQDRPNAKLIGEALWNEENSNKDQNNYIRKGIHGVQPYFHLVLMQGVTEYSVQNYFMYTVFWNLDSSYQRKISS